MIIARILNYTKTDLSLLAAVTLVITAIFGPGLQFSKVYLFHLVIIPFLIINFKPLTNIKSLSSNCFQHLKPYWFPIAYLLLSLTSLLWSYEPKEGIKKTIMISFGFVIFSAVKKICSSKGYFNFFKSILLFVIIFHVSFSFLESLTNITWPISVKSNLNSFFGVNFTYIANHGADVSQLGPRPTSFFWNINNSGLFSLMILPIMLFSQKRVSHYILPFLTYIILASTSRTIVLMFCLIILFFFITEGWSLYKRNKKNLFLKVLLITIGTTIFFSFKNNYQSNRLIKTKEILTDIKNESKFINKIATTQSTKKATPNNVSYTNNYSKKPKATSIEKRLIYTKESWKHFLSAPIFGIGSGALSKFRIPYIHGTLNLKSIHNYWLEVLTEMGLIFFSLYCLFLLQVTRKLVSNLNKTNKILLYSLVIFCVGCLSLSSATYYLPKWVIFSLCLYLPRISEEITV